MDCYLGMIVTFAYDWAPYSFAACNGQTMGVTQNQALFALMGNKFGGNGTSNFNLPDLRGRAPVHYGQGAYPIPLVNREFAAAFGQDNETLTTANVPLPAHTHTITEKTANSTVTATTTTTVNANSGNAGMPLPTNHYWAAPYSGSTQTYGYAGAKNVTMASDAVQVTVTPTFTVSNLAIGASGPTAAYPFALAQPSLALNFCICTSGLFPSRN